jgi:hypothetical protein
MSTVEKSDVDKSELSPAQRRVLDELEQQLKDASAKIQAQAPAHIRRLGKILRRSVKKDTLVKLRRFLKEQNIRIARRDLEAFRDHLIIHRIDLKDLEPAARARIFDRAHAKEDPRRMSPDYMTAANRGRIPNCRDCRWFVTAPKDDGDNAEKSCVEMGTKGADTACYGFTDQPN